MRGCARRQVMNMQSGGYVPGAAVPGGKTPRGSRCIYIYIYI